MEITCEFTPGYPSTINYQPSTFAAEGLNLPYLQQAKKVKSP
jgi:hypothetical protein